MSERKKFDDEGSAKGKIATSPDVTVQKPVQAQPSKDGKKPVPSPLATSMQPVQLVPDDSEADARYARMMGRLAKRVGGIDDTFAKELSEWGTDFIFPTLRDMFRNKMRAFRIFSGLAIAGPAVFFAVKTAFKEAKKEEKEDGKTTK